MVETLSAESRKDEGKIADDYEGSCDQNSIRVFVIVYMQTYANHRFIYIFHHHSLRSINLLNFFIIIPPSLTIFIIFKI